MSVQVGLVWAMASNGVIGRDGGLPWRLPDDLGHFKTITMGCPVVMGRKTFASLGKPLPGRHNFVLSRSEGTGPALSGVSHARSLDAALAAARAEHAAWVWVIGGAAVYAAALPHAARLEVTRVHAEVPGDVTFPAFDWRAWHCVAREGHAADARHEFAFTYERWERRVTVPPARSAVPGSGSPHNAG